MLTSASEFAADIFQGEFDMFVHGAHRQTEAFRDFGIGQPLLTAHREYAATLRRHRFEYASDDSRQFAGIQILLRGVVGHGGQKSPPPRNFAP